MVHKKYEKTYNSGLFPGRPVASSIIWGGGHIFIHSCSAQLVSFEIDCFYGLRTRIYEYMPPPPIIELATGLFLGNHPGDHYMDVFTSLGSA